MGHRAVAVGFANPRPRSVAPARKIPLHGICPAVVELLGVEADGVLAGLIESRPSRLIGERRIWLLSTIRDHGCFRDRCENQQPSSKDLRSGSAKRPSVGECQKTFGRGVPKDLRSGSARQAVSVRLGR